LLSHHRWPPTAIAELLGCDPATVRRWIHRYNQDGVIGLADRPRAGRPRLGSSRLAQRIRWLLAQPRAWTIPRLYQRLGRPAMSLRTLHRRVREVAQWRGPRLVAKGDPAREAVLAASSRPSGSCPRARSWLPLQEQPGGAPDEQHGRGGGGDQHADQQAPARGSWPGSWLEGRIVGGTLIGVSSHIRRVQHV
jgi:Homeodomain-like domain